MVYLHCNILFFCSTPIFCYNSASVSQVILEIYSVTSRKKSSQIPATPSCCPIKFGTRSLCFVCCKYIILIVDQRNPKMTNVWKTLLWQKQPRGNTHAPLAQDIGFTEEISGAPAPSIEFIERQEVKNM